MESSTQGSKDAKFREMIESIPLLETVAASDDLIEALSAELQRRAKWRRTQRVLKSMKITIDASAKDVSEKLKFLKKAKGIEKHAAKQIYDAACETLHLQQVSWTPAETNCNRAKREFMNSQSEFSQLASRHCRRASLACHPDRHGYLLPPSPPLKMLLASKRPLDPQELCLSC